MIIAELRTMSLFKNVQIFTMLSLYGRQWAMRMTRLINFSYLLSERHTEVIDVSGAFLILENLNF